MSLFNKVKMSLQHTITSPYLLWICAKDMIKMLVTMNDSDINRFKVIQDVNPTSRCGRYS